MKSTESFCIFSLGLKSLLAISLACSTFKEPRKLTGRSGTISSPNFPNVYPQSTECWYRITVPNGYRVELTFRYFRLEAKRGKGCVDYVRIWDLYHPLEEFCGISSRFSLKSKSNVASVMFHSDGANQYNGFELVFTANSLNFSNSTSSRGRTFSCFPDQFYCLNGKCIYNIFKCDGHDDCGDDTDEKNCSCPSRRLACGDRGQCLSNASKCDGEVNCENGADELDCDVLSAPPEKSSSSPETNTSLFPDTKENRSAANFSPTPSSLSSSPSVSSWSPSSSSSSSSSSKRKIVIAVAVPTIAGFFVVVICVIIWIYRYKRKKRSPGGNEVDVEFRTHDSSANQLMLRRDSLTHVSELDMQLDRKWEIDRKFISLQEELGKGEFGIVRKGEMLEMPSGLGPGLTTVAVKMLNKDANEKKRRDLLSELEIMWIIGKHKNIINFIGGCTQGGPLCIVVEFAPNGDLRQFLRDRRPTVECRTTLTLIDLVSCPYQVCAGMEYLSSKNVCDKM